jgi:hypothetical protein
MVISLLLKGLDGMRGERMENGGNIRRESENQNKIIPVFFMESWVYQAENSFNKKRGNNIEPSHIPPPTTQDPTIPPTLLGQASFKGFFCRLLPPF